MKEVRPTYAEIAARAYHLYLERGRKDGQDRDDWLQAEYELIQLPVRKIAELAPVKPVPIKAKVKAPSLVEVVRMAMIIGPSGQNPQSRAAAQRRSENRTETQGSRRGSRSTLASHQPNFARLVR